MNPRTALIVAGLALVIGAVGLVIGISAKNGNQSDQDIADATKAQLEQQLGTTATKVRGAEQLQANQEKAQATQQAEASKSVNVQLTDLRASVDRLDNSGKSLRGTSDDPGERHQDAPGRRRQARDQGRESRSEIVKSVSY